MNSILALTLLISLSASADEAYEKHEITFTGGEYKEETFGYRLLKPENLEEGKKYPLIFFLHGAGERGDDNKLQLKHFPELMSQPERRKEFPCFVVAPQCRNGKQWVEVPWGAKTSTEMKAEPSDQLKMAIAIFQEVVEKYPIDKNRVYLTGLSMGGYGTWELAARKPEWFAAVMPICGGGDERQAAKYKDLPLWAFHGGKDTVVPTVRSQQMVEAIKEAGGNPKYTEFKGVGHGSWGPAYKSESGALKWMFEQKK